jgi:hypothetical protein
MVIEPSLPLQVTGFSLFIVGERTGHCPLTLMENRTILNKHRNKASGFFMEILDIGGRYFFTKAYSHNPLKRFFL